MATRCIVVGSGIALRDMPPTGQMKQFILTFLLLVSIALFGASPHAAMADASQTMSIPCHAQTAAMIDESQAAEHGGSDDQTMVGTCAIACIGSISAWASGSAQPLLVLRPAAHDLPLSRVLPGRLGETADRPPQSI